MCKKIRLSAHNLHIETGRYKRPRKTPIEERLCSYCLSLNIDEIEDEYRVSMSCPRYIRQRRNLLNGISSIINLDLFSLTELFNLILQC